MNNIQEKENNPYQDNAELWQDWLNHGVTESTPLNVEFQFLSKKKKSADEFAKNLEKSGFQVMVDKFIDDKQWDIIAMKPNQTWSLNKLNQQAKELSELATKNGCFIDGIGAMLPR